MKRILLLSTAILLSITSFAGKDKSKKGKTEKAANTSALSLTWQEMGPNNIAGKIKAILIDKNNSQRYYAASASGGLWVTNDGGSSWDKLKDDFDNNIISCMAYGADGALYVGTGEYLFGYLGGGLFRSTDNGASFSRITSTVPAANDTTDDFAYINAIACHPTEANKIYLATNKGLKISKDGGATWMDVFGARKFPASDIKIGSDGTYYLAQDAFKPWQSNKFKGTCNFYTSTNGDTGVANWTSQSSYINYYQFDSVGIEIPTSFPKTASPTASRDSAYGIKIAVSPTNSAYVYALVIRYSRQGGIYKSTDHGNTWTQIGPGNTGQTGSSALFNPFSNAAAASAYSIVVSPSNPDEIYIGGTNLWSYNPNSGWTQLSNSNSFPFLSDFVPKGIQSLAFAGNRLILGTSNGVTKSDNLNPGNPSFIQINSNLRTASLYRISPTIWGNAIAGTKSDGCLLIPNSSTISAGQQLAGDTVANLAVSMISANGVFVSRRSGQVSRSANGGDDFGSVYDGRLESFKPAGATSAMIGNAQLTAVYTPMDYWESFSDPLSRDTMLYIYGGSAPIAPGVPFTVQSPNGLLPFSTTLADTLFPNSAVKIVNPITSKMIVGFKDEIWMGNRLADFIGTPVWVRIGSSTASLGGINNKSKFTGTPSKVKFTTDGNTAFIGTENGQVYRITNLRSAVDSASGDIFSNRSQVVGKLIGVFPRRIMDIASDPIDSNKIIVILGGGYNQSNFVYRCANALTVPAVTSGFTNFELIQTNLPLMPVYTAIIDYTDDNRLIVGTETGVYGTDSAWTATPSWSDLSNGMAKIPVLELKQQTFGSEFGIVGSGNIYAATAGRGVFKTASLANGINRPKSQNEETINKILVYPNPANDNVTIEYTLKKESDVTLRIFNLDGKIVKEQSMVQTKAGVYKLNINVSELSSGSYFISVMGKEIKDFNTLIISR